LLFFARGVPAARPGRAARKGDLMPSAQLHAQATEDRRCSAALRAMFWLAAAAAVLVLTRGVAAGVSYDIAHVRQPLFGDNVDRTATQPISTSRVPSCRPRESAFRRSARTRRY